MMNTKQAIYLFAAVLFTAFMVATGCSDDSSTSSEMDDPPELPSEITPVTVDMSYFNENEVPMDEQHSAYHQVKNYSVSNGQVLNSGMGYAALPASFLMFAESGIFESETEQSNGTWIYRYEIPEEWIDDNEKEIAELAKTGANNVVIELHATPTGNGVEWEVYFTGEIDGQQVNNFRFMSGFVSNDETTGEWNFYSPESGNTPVITYEYKMESESVYTASFTFSEGGESGSMEYRKDGVENWMSFNSGGESADWYWNESTNSGWIESNGGERQCYSNFENTSC